MNNIFEDLPEDEFELIDILFEEKLEESTKAFAEFMQERFGANIEYDEE